METATFVGFVRYTDPHGTPIEMEIWMGPAMAPFAVDSTFLADVDDVVTSPYTSEEVRCPYQQVQDALARGDYVVAQGVTHKTIREEPA